MGFWSGERPLSHDHATRAAGTALRAAPSPVRVAGTAFSVDHAMTPRATAPPGTGKEPPSVNHRQCHAAAAGPNAASLRAAASRRRDSAGPGGKPPDPRASRSQRSAREEAMRLLRAEWTKFRTVRGWVIGMVIAAFVTVLIGYLTAEGSNVSCSGNGGPCHAFHPLGPGGEAVTDSFYFVHRPLAGNGTITARVTSLTGLLPTSPGGRARAGQSMGAGMRPGLEPWSKAGL